MTHRVRLHCKQTNRIYTGDIYISPRYTRELLDALGARNPTLLERVRRWLGLAPSLGSVDVEMYLPSREDEGEDDA